uniref:Protein Rev n=3 Tax=Human immunodeficiency virus type 1 TaxID=11676 RepID=A0A0H3Y977_HV1|nr:truncated rev protein [Human immunodeficiency virus 1]
MAGRSGDSEEALLQAVRIIKILYQSTLSQTQGNPTGPKESKKKVKSKTKANPFDC